MKKTLTLLLCALMLASSLASCGNDSGAAVNDTAVLGGNDTVNDTAAETTTAGEVAREDTPDNLPELDFKGESIGIFFPESHGGTADQIDFVKEDDGDIVNSAVYERQVAVEERLGVKLEIKYDTAVKQVTETVRNEVLSGGDAYDIVYGPQSVSVPLIMESIYLDMSDSKYIDFDQPWWHNDLMDEMTVGRKRYVLAGDISLSVLNYTSCFYFNKPQFTAISGGQTDKDLYELVLDGGWTMDKLAEYVKASYKDLNGDGVSDEKDQFGMGAVTASTVDHMFFDSGARITTRDANNIPKLTMNNERTVAFTEKLYDLFYNNPGTLVLPANQDSLRITIPNKLMNREMTFMAGYFYSATMLRDMEDDYGLIPYPKLDENIENYGALVHNSAHLVSVPATCGIVDTVSAVIEAIAAETYRSVTPAYYEVALKTKYIRDDVSGQIVDMINAACTTDFAYVYSTNMNKIGTMMRELMVAKTSDFASYYAKYEPAAQKGLEELLEKFDSLD